MLPGLKKPLTLFSHCAVLLFSGVMIYLGVKMIIVIEVLYRSMDKFALVVVMFFVLCGNIMTTGTIVEKLIKTANVMVGFLPGVIIMAAMSLYAYVVCRKRGMQQ